MKWYFVVLFLIMFALIVGSYFLFRDQAAGGSNIRFLSKQDLAQVLIDNKDRYYDSFHQNDLKARHIQSIEEYHPIIQKSSCQGTRALKDRIVQAISSIESQLSKKGDTTVHGIHLPSLLSTPWTIGFVCDKKYEYGYPHTRYNVIVLQVADCLKRSDKQLAQLLMHEKTHVYQKTHVNEMDDYLRNQGFKIIKQKQQKDIYYPANPDIDENLYEHLATKFKYYAKYRKQPNGGQDIVYPDNQSKNEHPLEEIAYKMEALLS